MGKGGKRRKGKGERGKERGGETRGGEGWSEARWGEARWGEARRGEGVWQQDFLIFQWLAFKNEFCFIVGYCPVFTHF